MDLFVGGNSKRIHGDLVDLNGLRCFSAFYSPLRDGVSNLDPSRLIVLGDSGAFQDVKESSRVSLEAALNRQLQYELILSKTWNCDWQFHSIASYDRLIDEKWIGGCKVKQRWSEEDAWIAVEQTIDAAAYLAKHRTQLDPRILVLGCQGVTARQYKVCVSEVIKYAVPGDWIGLGGWCILGKQQQWFNTFCHTLLEVIPLIAKSGIKHVHLYGVLWLPALGVYKAMCDAYNLTCSTDSKKPLSDCRWKTEKQRLQAGARAHHWRDNVNWWKDQLKNLHSTRYYRFPVAQIDLLLYLTELNNEYATRSYAES